MKITGLLFIFLFTILAGTRLSGKSPVQEHASGVFQPDTILENQFLYKGRIWRNLYSMVKGDQFLFSPFFSKGSVTMDGNKFNDIFLRYDIYSDELLAPANSKTLIVLNKEMVDSFELYYNNKKYSFINLQDDSTNGIKGYCNVLYNGKTALYVKYKKHIDLLGVDNRFDLFYQTWKLFILKDGVPCLITGRRDFLKLFSDYKSEIGSFIKKNRLRISKNDPESFVPLVKYVDSIRH
jgi:hypothetical protein